MVRYWGREERENRGTDKLKHGPTGKLFDRPRLDPLGKASERLMGGVDGVRIYLFGDDETCTGGPLSEIECGRERERADDVPDGERGRDGEDEANVLVLHGLWWVKSSCSYVSHLCI